MGPFTIGAGLRGERVIVKIARRFSKRHTPSSHISIKTREASQCSGSELVADVHEPVAIFEVRTVRDHDQLRSVDAGAAAVLRMQVHRKAGAIGRLNKDSAKAIAPIETDTRGSNQTAGAPFSSQAHGTNGAIRAWRSNRSCVAAESHWPNSTSRANFAIQSWETSGSGATARTRSAIRTHRLKSGFNSWEDSGPDEAAWKVSAHRIHCSGLSAEPIPIPQIKESLDRPERTGTVHDP
jgi:hypothetical protein